MSAPDPALTGRPTECQTLDQLLAGARSGRSQVLVLRGEAGIGKTALLDYVATQATGCRVLQASGVESEMELAFAGLHQLGPLLDRRENLPDPQRDALATAFGLTTGSAPDRFLVGLAVLSLLSQAGEHEPVVCLIDDVQWMDQISLQTLAFVARRLLAEPVALVFAVREPADRSELAGLPALMVRGLHDVDARALLGSVVQGPLDAAVRDRIIDETRGNPLALLEMPRGLTPAQLAGGFGLPETMPMANRIEQGFLRRLEPLPDDTRELLLAAAVEPRGDANLLWRAVERLGISPQAAKVAEESGLIELGVRVRFRHPLVRSAVCRAAGLRELQKVHGVLAEETDAVVDPDRKAWHRAKATAGPDEDVAAALEQSADRAQARGGVAAAAAFLARSTELTPDPVRQGERALAAAHAAHLAGAPDDALKLLVTAEAAPQPEGHGARVQLLRAQIAFTANRGNDAPPLLLQAARRLEAVDLDLARGTYRDALLATQFAGRFAESTDMVELARALRDALPPEAAPKEELLLDGRAVLFTDGYRAAMPILSGALQAFCTEDVSLDQGLRWMWLATLTAADVWDDERWELLAAHHVRKARESGAFSELPMALGSRSLVHVFAGELAAAASAIEEARAVAEATGNNFVPSAAMGIAVWRGREQEAGELLDLMFTEALALGQGRSVTFTLYLRSVLANGSGRYADGLSAADRSHPTSPSNSVVPMKRQPSPPWSGWLFITGMSAKVMPMRSTVSARADSPPADSAATIETAIPISDCLRIGHLLARRANR